MLLNTHTLEKETECIDQLAAATQRFYDSTHSPGCDHHLDDDTLARLVSQSGIKK